MSYMPDDFCKQPLHVNDTSKQYASVLQELNIYLIKLQKIYNLLWTLLQDQSLCMKHVVLLENFMHKLRTLIKHADAETKRLNNDVYLKTISYHVISFALANFKSVLECTECCQFRISFLQNMNQECGAVDEYCSGGIEQLLLFKNLSTYASVGRPQNEETRVSNFNDKQDESSKTDLGEERDYQKYKLSKDKENCKVERNRRSGVHYHTDVLQQHHQDSVRNLLADCYQRCVSTIPTDDVCPPPTIEVRRNCQTCALNTPKPSRQTTKSNRHTALRQSELNDNYVDERFPHPVSRRPELKSSNKYHMKDSTSKYNPQKVLNQSMHSFSAPINEEKLMQRAQSIHRSSISKSAREAAYTQLPNMCVNAPPNLNPFAQ